jgi:hypothetical protein
MLIALISCVAKKQHYATIARELYTSPLFKDAYSYAKKLGAERIFILSAKYGLLPEDKVVEPYNETLNDKSLKEVKCWAEKVINELSQISDLHKDNFLILAGERYIKFIVGSLTNYEVPLKGLSIGKQLSYYKEALAK